MGSSQVVSLSKTLYPLLSTGSTEEMTEKIVYWDVNNQIKQRSSKVF